MSVEVRTNGEGDHELGAEIRGAWVPFVTKAGGYVDALVTRAKEVKAAQPQPAKRPSRSKAASGSGEGGGEGEGGDAGGSGDDNGA